MELVFASPNSPDEIKIIYQVLNAVNINDITLDYKNDKLFATDGDNIWIGKEFYDFILDEVFVYEGNKVVGMKDELYKQFVELSKQYRTNVCKKVYIAGPDVFSPESDKLSALYKKALNEANIEGLYPTDNHYFTSKEIVNGNFALIDEADIVIANMNPFRGQEPDSGTAVEIGYAIAKGKEIYCYVDDDTPLKDKYGKKDENGWFYEDFGYPLNIMIAEKATIVKGDFFKVVKLLKNQ